MKLCPICREELYSTCNHVPGRVIGYVVITASGHSIRRPDRASAEAMAAMCPNYRQISVIRDYVNVITGLVTRPAGW